LDEEREEGTGGEGREWGERKVREGREGMGRRKGEVKRGQRRKGFILQDKMLPIKQHNIFAPCKLLLHLKYSFTVRGTHNFGENAL